MDFSLKVGTVVDTKYKKPQRVGEGTIFDVLDSPALTGTPTAPTPETGDSSTNIATTAFVSGAVESGSEYTNMLDKLAYETQLHGYLADRISRGGGVKGRSSPPAGTERAAGAASNLFRGLPVRDGQHRLCVSFGRPSP